MSVEFSFEEESNSTMARTGGYDPSDGTLVIDNLTKEFGGLTAVDKLSFTVQDQEIVGFIGPNGAGKSTTFNCITGVYQPTGGTVWYKGQDVTGLAGYEIVDRGIARTFQTFAPLKDRTVLQNVAFAMMPDQLLSLSSLFSETAHEAAKVCEAVGLGNDLEKTPSELAHAGMLRLELGRAIATDPDILLVDEPFAGLSNVEVQQFTELFESLRDHGMTLVVIDHNMHGLLSLIDRAIVIQFGAKIAEGSPEEIKNDETVQEAYLGGDIE